MKTLIQLIVGIAICIGAAFFLRINPEVDYSWLMGVVHGLLIVPNCIISIFDPSWLLKAPLHTSGYNTAWWIFSICDILYWIWAIVGAVIAIAHNRK